MDNLTRMVQRMDIRVKRLEECRELWENKKNTKIVAFYANPWIVVRRGSKVTPAALHLVAIGSEMREVMSKISPLEVAVIPGTTQKVFLEELVERRPQVVSLSMHNQETQGLLFESETGYVQMWGRRRWLMRSAKQTA